MKLYFVLHILFKLDFSWLFYTWVDVIAWISRRCSSVGKNFTIDSQFISLSKWIFARKIRNNTEQSIAMLIICVFFFFRSASKLFVKIVDVSCVCVCDVLCDLTNWSDANFREFCIIFYLSLFGELCSRFFFRCFQLRREYWWMHELERTNKSVRVVDGWFACIVL